jgi:hypothetical protein
MYYRPDCSVSDKIVISDTIQMIQFGNDDSDKTSLWQVIHDWIFKSKENDQKNNFI